MTFDLLPFCLPLLLFFSFFMGDAQRLCERQDCWETVPGERSRGGRAVIKAKDGYVEATPTC